MKNATFNCERKMNSKSKQQAEETAQRVAMSVNDFTNKLIKDVEKICRDIGKNYDKEQDRGFAFQLWCAELLSSVDGIEEDPSECVFKSNDLKFDIAMEDEDAKLLILAQTKYVSPRQKPDVDETEVHDFFKRHNILLDEGTWFDKHAPDELHDLLSDYKDRLKNGWKVKFYFISTGTSSQRIKDLVESLDKTVKGVQESVSFDILDFYGIKEIYARTQSLESSISPFVEIQFARGNYFFKEKPHQTLLSIVKGNTLVGLYKKERDGLFAHNIRSFLGKRVNKEVVETASERADEFYYFNNGVSAICTHAEDLGNDKLRLHHFQIINGAQTVGSLASVRNLSSNCEVLLRITVGASVSTEKGINADIIRYNNTQNVVKSSDFRSNDKIQLWIEKRFAELKPRGAIREPIRYVRKRTIRRVRAAIPLKLEELAKIRYAFYFEPTRCIADPRSLWTLLEDDGHYEYAFGRDGDAVDFWTETEFENALFAVTTYFAILAKTKDLIKRDKAEFHFLQRLRFWGVSLAAVHIDEKKLAVRELLQSEAAFKSWFDDFWKASFLIYGSAHDQAQSDKISNFALARNESRWAQVRKSFLRNLKAGVA
jgi:hypothetical protein